MSITELARPDIAAMKPYSSARLEAPGRGILLNANEAPWPLLEPEGTRNGLNRYPDPQPAELLRQLATLYEVPADGLLVTRGSDEGIDLLTRVFCRAGEDAILQCPPTFGMYRIAAQAQGADVVSIPRDAAQGFALDQQAVLDALAPERRIKIIFLTSPNNPTGETVGRDFLEALLQATHDRCLVVMDEAYIEFCERPSATHLVTAHDNLVVLRTMSKAWAAAGLRCGTVIAHPAVIGLLRRIIAPYPLPEPVVSLALRMLTPDMLQRQQLLLQRVHANKERLLSLLEGRPFVLELLPGEANFVLFRAESAAALLEFCARRNVVLRGFPADPVLREWVRISVGSGDDLDALGAVFDEWEAER